MFQNSKKLIFAAIVLLVLVGFAGCNIVDGGLQVEDAMSRKVGTAPGQGDRTQPTGAPKAFTATVTLYQDTKSVVTRPSGESNHYKTVAETLESYLAIESSDWDLLVGKHVVMSNVTNYNADYATFPVPISGTNHSVIDIIDENGDTVLTLQANGTLNGSYIFGAEIDMNWVVKDSYGAKVNARGKVSGMFVWFGKEVPEGTFTLTGTYN